MKYRIAENTYRGHFIVEQLNHFLFIPYWVRATHELLFGFGFATKEKALEAIEETKKSKYKYYEV